MDFVHKNWFQPAGCKKIGANLDGKTEAIFIISCW